MKTKPTKPAKSELEYYKSIREYSPRELKIMGRIMRMTFLRKEYFLFFFFACFSILPWILVIYLINPSEMLTPSVILIIVYPIIYGLILRPASKNIKEDISNAKKAYDAVIKENSMS